MNFNTLINRYIFRELFPPFVVTLAIFSFILLLTRILEITNMVVNYKIGLITVFSLIVYTMPFFLIYVIPMSVMIATLLTFMRLAGDNEIIALKSGGVSLYDLLPPVFTFCLIAALLTGFMAIHALPWGMLSFKRLAADVITSNIDLGLKERTFYDKFKNVVLYVNRIDVKNRNLIDVFIVDNRNPKTSVTIVSPKGEIYTAKDDSTVLLRLSKGTINQVDLEKRRTNTIRFEKYSLNLDLKQFKDAGKKGEKDETEMSLTELIRYIENKKEKDSDYYVALLEYHRKFSMPFACFPLALLGIPLGIQVRSSRKSYGLVLGMTFFLFYYILLTGGLVWGESGSYPPLIGMWVPNIVMGGIGIFFLKKNQEDREVQFDPVGYLKKLLKQKP